MKRLLLLTNFFAVSITLTAQLSFNPSVNCTAEANPYSVISADFNGHGKVDLAIANQNVNNVSVPTLTNILQNNLPHNSNSHVQNLLPKCGSSLLFNSSNAAQREAFDEKLYYNSINSANSRTASIEDSTLYNLPLAIHVVHQNGTENISDVDIYDAVEILNKAFRSQTPFDTIVGSDIHIQFCLPWGAITRHISPLTNMYVDNNIDDPALKQIGLMNNLNYINIWVVKSITSVYQGSGVAGYSTLPYAHGTAADGIVIEADWIKNDANAVKILIHEMGHYFGLYHTFEGGCNNTNCMLQGDRVCDTPPDNSAAAVSCNSSVNSCNSDEDDASSQNPFRSVALGGLGDQSDMFQNYMDYGHQTCMNRFTKGQRTRMRTGLLETRQSLLQNASALCTSCSNSLAVSLNIPDTLLSGVTHTLTVNVSDTTGLVYYWFLGSQFFTTQTFTYTSQITGSLPLMLIVNNPALNCSSLLRDTIMIYCPASSPVINANPSGAYSLGETVTFSTPNNGFSYTWQVDGITAGTGTQYSHTLTDNLGHLLTLTANNGVCTSTGASYYINPNNCGSSKENNTWQFGNGAGINFNTNPPTSIPGSFTNYDNHQNYEGCAVICDADGSALYASNGIQVWNAQTGTNLSNGGDSLKGSVHSSQSALFVPKPASNLIYLFHLEDQGGIYPNSQGGIYYSIIDKNTNALTVKNQLLLAPACEKVTAVKNMSGDGIWVIAHKYNSNQFYAWLVTAAGVSSPIITAAGSAHAPAPMQDPGYIPIGQITASPSGQKLALASCGLAFVEVFNFNNSNGVVSNPVKLNVSTSEEPYGVAFSPNERYVYACNGNLGNSLWKTYRWDMQAGNISAINSSYVLLGSGNNSARGTMQLAPDGKIYCGIGQNEYKFLAVISNPNAVNAANCDYQKDGFKLLHGSTLFGLPNPVQSVLANTNPNIIGTDKICLNGSSQTLQYMFYPTANASYTWTHKGTNTATVLTDSTLSITFTQAGIDTLVVKRHAYCGDSYDTLFVNSGFPSATLNLGNDTTLCMGMALVLNAGVAMYDYVWSNGVRTQTVSFTTTGKVWAQVTTQQSCILSDTLNILRYQLPELTLGIDTSLCGTQTLTLTAPTGVDSYSWNTGAITQSIVADSGLYTVNVTKYGCTFTASKNILRDIIQNILPADTIIQQPCNQTSISLPLGYSSYLWKKPNGGTEITPGISLIDPGWYNITYSNACGEAKDSVFYKTLRFFAEDSIITCADTAFFITDKIIYGALWKKLGGTTSILLLPGSGYIQTGDTVKVFRTGEFDFTVIDSTTNCAILQQVVVMVDTALTRAPMDINLGNDVALCIGDIKILDAGAGFDWYRWNTTSNMQSITAYQFGTYWINARYCGYNYSDTITINNSSIVQISGDSLLCENETVMLIALPAGGNYMWDSLGVQISTSSNMLPINHAGIYRVINQVCDSVVWSLPFLVQEENCVITNVAVLVNANYGLVIYPNPSSGIFNFSNYTNVHITNTLGQIIMGRKNVSSIDLREQSAGIYFITFIDDSGKVLQRNKIMKE
jgi:6-phosphogluconolactonase (cycloisomerase 2 family)